MASTLIPLAILLIAKDVLSGSIDINPKVAVVREGESFTVLCQSGTPLQYCRMVLPGPVTRALDPLTPAKGGISYYGEGREKGQCGMKIDRVTEAFNGQIKCTAGVLETGDELLNVMQLIVARAPSPPELSVSTDPKSPDYYKEGGSLSATCTVQNGRPAANISWYIGNQRITEGLSLPTEFKTNNDLYTITQNLTKTLSANDNGKALKCVAQHPLLSNNKNTTQRQLNVHFPPKPLPSPVEQFGLVEGVDGEVTVSVMANPKPRFEWSIGEEKVLEGSSIGRYHVKNSVEDQNKGTGYWTSVLLINTLTKEDVATVYTLKANNKLGEETYRVSISTNPEPKTMPLGAGTIAAIVIAVLVILLITAILVFARAKGRWCFAGKTALLRTAGESSDTESAEHHGETKSKMIFTSVFKKKSDKVSVDTPKGKDVTVNDEKTVTEEEGEASLKPKTEDGVVYAELDLQNSPPSRGLLVRPENDKTEYAEIIHTKEAQ